MPDYQHGGDDPYTLMPKTYSARELRTIRTTSQHDQRLKILPFGAIRKIKELKLKEKEKQTKHQNSI